MPRRSRPSSSTASATSASRSASSRVFVLFGSIDFDTVFAQRARRSPARRIHFLGYDVDALTVALPAAVHGRDGQVGAVPAAHLAARRDGRPDAGLRADPCRHHGDGRRVHGGAAVAAVRAGARRAWRSCTFIGATTAFFAATVGLVQNDIKRVIAYSTCSQLGYMFVAMGVGAYSVGMFHLFTHAFFKALLFLGSGSVIHAMHHEQDMRKMGGLRRKIPLTYCDDADRHAGADRLSRSPPASSPRTRSSRPPTPAQRDGAATPSSDRRRRGADLVLFLAADLHDLPRRSRTTSITTKHAHESPLVMLVPLAVLAVGSIVRRLAVLGTSSSARAPRHSSAESLTSLPNNHVLDEMHTSAAWVDARADGHDGRRLRSSPGSSTSAGPTFRRAWRAQHGVLYLFLLNKWYFDELYDLLFVRPAMWLGRAAVEGRRRLHHRRLRARRRVRARARRDAQRRAAADRLPLPLRLRHADRRRRLRHLVHVRGGALMTSWPILSVVTFLPLVGALFIVLSARRRGRRAQRALDRAVDHARHLRDLADPGLALRPGSAGLPVRREARLARRRHHLPDGRRRHLAAVRDPHHGLMPICILASWTSIETPRQGIHDRLPGARDADGRHVLRARPRAVLPVLRGRPDPDVPDHRRLGRPAARLCQLQVLPLHAARLGADAARHHGDVLAGRHHRHPDAAASRLPARRCRPGCGSPSSPRSR